MKKEWEVNDDNRPKRCEKCGRAFEPPLTPSENSTLNRIVTNDAVEKPKQEPPPCGEMGVWTDEEGDVDPNQHKPSIGMTDD